MGKQPILFINLQDSPQEILIIRIATVPSGCDPAKDAACGIGRVVSVLSPDGALNAIDGKYRLMVKGNQPGRRQAIEARH